MENPLGDGPTISRDWQTVGVASGLGCTVVTSLLLCIGGGVLLDRWLDTSPVLTLIGLALGLVTAGYTLYELAVMSDPDRGMVRLRKRGAASRPGRSGEDSTQSRSG